jgi:ATP-dependent exoDNAse (exonuclease V) beta subunit
VLDWLRETERGAQTTPAMVARKLAEYIETPPQVPEAALLDPAQNAVTIMTVHGSKGLTKRVVMIPDCSFQPDSDRDFARIFFTTETQRHGEEETSEPPGLRGRNIPSLGIRITDPNKGKAESPGFKAANDRAKIVREHELKNLFYVAMTRARDLVVTSATVGSRASGWLKQLEPLLGKQIPQIPYSALSEAATSASPVSIKVPNAQQLAESLNTLPPAPAVPRLQRMPATRFAKEQDEAEFDPVYETSNFQPLENAAAVGSLGHAVLEQLVLNEWDGSVENWLEKLRGDFGVSKTEAFPLMDRIEDVRQQMQTATNGMPELLPEFPFVLLVGDVLIDGTVDLLCRTSDGYAIFDYKFTEGSDDSVVAKYQGQMNLYRKAAEKRFPSADKSEIWLVVISSRGTRFVKSM